MRDNLNVLIKGICNFMADKNLNIQSWWHLLEMTGNFCWR